MCLHFVDSLKLLIFGCFGFYLYCLSVVSLSSEEAHLCSSISIYEWHAYSCAEAGFILLAG